MAAPNESGSTAAARTVNAKAAGVATSYLDWSGREVTVAAETIDQVLGLVGEPTPHSVEAGAVATVLSPAPRTWGWMVQLYALHSAGSWAIGDFADLRELVTWSAREHNAGLVLINPVHAVAPVLPIENSPYFPTSRRYVNPIYLRIEDIEAYREAAPELQRTIDGLRPVATSLIDRDRVWTAKLQALELLLPTDWAAPDDTDLVQFATFCALAERHGLPWQDWPETLHHPDLPDVAAAGRELRDRVRLHAWAQTLCDQQLAAAQQAAVTGGMPIGVVHDLAIGVDPGGADAWLLQDALAGSVTVGAPPDSFNQKGQDWSLPPWQPGALAAADYGPLRAIVGAILSRGGGLRVDHVMGLFRLWWVPPGKSAADGTYVYYDAQRMLEAVCDVAADHGAQIIGEDLGTVEDGMRESLAARGILGSSVLWFEREDDNPVGPPKEPSEWRELAAASISTHDLPTAAGFLTGEHVRVRDELGQLARPVADEQLQADQERNSLLGLLLAEDMLAVDDIDDVDAVVLAMHRLLAATPCRLLLASPYDVLGEVSQPNLPGTTDQYPNWRLPLSATLEAFQADPRVAATGQLLGAARPAVRPK